MEPTLLEILDARENRVVHQRELLTRFGKPLLCFTMNIPGPVKLDRDISIGFYVGCRLLKDALRGCKLLHSEEHRHNTGCEAYYVVDMPATDLKKLAMELEDTEMIGRLFDMDVLDEAGQKLSREALGGGRRKCLLCDNDAVVCAGRRAHPLEELTDRTSFLLFVAAQHYLCEYIAARAYMALQAEVTSTPKPGLVDRENQGAHKDMDLRHFFVSANTLRPFFCRLAQEGFRRRDDLPQDAFAAIRSIGIEAEQAMRKATGGVNTHKGAIFTLGLICAALGRLDPAQWQADKILSECAAMTQGITARDFAGITRDSATTAGQTLYVRYGITGVRGQAESGFPAIAQVGLPTLKKGIEAGLSLNDAACCVLIHLICATEDTNMIHRGGMEKWKATQQQLRQLLKATPFPSPDTLRKLNGEFIKDNLSPGGSADLLAATLFLYFL